MRFSCANSLSTFFRSLQEIAYSGVWAIARARSRDGSQVDRRTLREGHLGQQRTFNSQASQSALLAR